MKILKLTLTNFRNFQDLAVAFSYPQTIIIAGNAQGKTNILEGIYFMATGKSFKAGLERESIRQGGNFANVEADIENKEGMVGLRIYLESNPDKENLSRKKFHVNAVSRSLGKFLGNFQAVLFSPEDINLLDGSPSLRRHYLDLILSQTNRPYWRTLNQYQKLITRRNKLLYQIREGFANIDQLLYWDSNLLQLGEVIFQKRKEAIEFLAIEMKRLGKEIEREKNDLELIYQPNILTETRLRAHREQEIAAAMSLIGPHRDDFVILWKGNDLSSYGSRGEKRLAVLALKLAETNYIAEKVGEKPVLLLDDIFSELDHHFRHKILELFNEQQTILTTTDTHLVEKVFLDKAKVVNLNR